MSHSIGARTALLLASAACLAALDGAAVGAPSQSKTTQLQVVIHVFSGRPNPVFTLDASEAREAQSWLAHAVEAARAPDSRSAGEAPRTVFPNKLGYIGISIRELGGDGGVLSETEVMGRDGLVRLTGQQPRRTAGSDDVERELLDLAASKGVIDDELRAIIQQSIERRSSSSDAQR
jgi:hypothetical protein